MLGIEIDLNNKTKKIRYDFNALADLENKLGMGIGTILEEKNLGFDTIRHLLWAGLKWSDHGLTVQRVGQMLQKYLEDGENLQTLIEKINEALKISGLFTSDEGNQQPEAVK